MVVTATHALAEQAGIYAGMAVADAKAMLPSLQVFDDKPNLQSQLLQRITEWCIRYTPSAAVDPLGGIILDASGCAHLWGSDEAYVKDIIKRLKEKGYTAKAAMADTIGTAWAVARFGKILVIEPAKHTDALLTLPPQSLRLESDAIERLHKLGLQTIKDFISIPQSALRRRFGKLIVQRMAQAVGTEEEVIQPHFPIEPYQERLPCLEPIVRIEGIEIALQKLLEVLCTRLKKESKGLRTAHFKGYRVDSKIVSVHISTGRPSNNVKHLFNLFQLKLSTIEPGLGIELFVLEATKVEDYIPMQEELWKKNNGLNDQHLSELIDRLTGKIGADAIHRYLPDEHFWPERSFKNAATLHEQPATAWRRNKPRPLHLFSPPERIEVTAPIPDYPPMLFRYKGKLHKINKADGPERIEQEWWIQEGEHRDYYAVEDEEGCRYWLFRSGHYDEEKKVQWFLHGVFP
jgi:protein ImuB